MKRSEIVSAARVRGKNAATGANAEDRTPAKWGADDEIGAASLDNPVHWPEPPVSAGGKSPYRFFLQFTAPTG